MFEMDPYIHARMDPKWVPKRGAPWDAPENLALARERIPWYVCPALKFQSDANGLGLTHYVASLGVGEPPFDHKHRGAFDLDHPTPIANIRDMIIVFETAHDLGPWAAGGRPTARPFLPEGAPPFGRDGQFGGLHRGGANVAFVNVHVIFVSDRIDATVLRAYVTATAADIPPARLESVLLVQFRGPAHGGVVGFEPVDDLDAVAVRVPHEEPVAVRDRSRFLNLNSQRPEVRPRRDRVVHTQREVSRAAGVRLRLLEQVQRLPVFEPVPQRHEIERPRFGDFFQPQRAAVERARFFQIGYDYRAMIEPGETNSHRSPHTRAPA
jgi:hypothetical protein